jgi:hypothetical protein
MEIKDPITIIASACALILSIISLIITLIQKNRETNRTIRKTLTDTLEDISKIAIESTKLKGSKDIDFNSEYAIQLRRNYNTQRRILIAHADYIIRRYNKLSTEIDCNILAGAYANIGDQDKAEYFWQKTIDKSISLPIKHMNLRGFGTFLFNCGKEESGRQMFSKAFILDLAENDDNKILRADTYIMLSDLEKKDLDKKDQDLNLIKAAEICSTIANIKMKKELEERIRLKLPKTN